MYIIFLFGNHLAEDGEKQLLYHFYMFDFVPVLDETNYLDCQNMATNRRGSADRRKPGRK